jgi:hypothetical protein
MHLLKVETLWMELCLYMIFYMSLEFKKKQGMVFKIDFEKPYDKINWIFCLKVWNSVVLVPLGADG